MCCSWELLFACEVPRENKEQEEQEKLDKAKEGEAALYAKAEDAYVTFCKKGHLLDPLNATKVQDSVRCFCCVEKRGKGDTFSRRSKSKKNLKARMTEVKPVWTEYFPAEVQTAECHQ